jgi:hypothetical protein
MLRDPDIAGHCYGISFIFKWDSSLQHTFLDNEFYDHEEMASTIYEGKIEDSVGMYLASA